ncbi:uncharacterized protein LOC135145066 [Zophobas morio]|uniref:uncharacterized protein LOC135145066 n=1 Tax=Zophobas morio TaxID=2755281 RepID=UPI003082AAAC
MQEAQRQNFKDYKSLNDFFTRQLSPLARPIEDSIITSPADGRVLYLGPVPNGRVEAVKGISYSIERFLGEVPIPREGYSLQQITIYLSPSDCHRFHSPTNWNIRKRVHFPGDLLSVAPPLTHVIEGLFNYNERVALSGTWINGFFSFIAIGAFNVGSICFYFDSELSTNCKKDSKLRERKFKHFSDPLLVPKGEEIGLFKFGSCIVLIFEMPQSFKFLVAPGDKVRIGQSLVK